MNSPLSVKPAYLAALMCVLAVYTAFKGVLPAFRAVDSDFPNYYVAARVALEGRDPARLYDDEWFQNQIFAAGLRQQGKFAPFPPATSLVLIPLTMFSPLTALRIMTVLNLLLLAAATKLLARYCGFTLLEASVLALLSGAGLINCIRLGQFYIAVSCSTLLGFSFLANHRDLWAGAILGAPVPIKYFPAVYLAYLGMKRRWMVLISAGAVMMGIVGASILILGWEVHAEFIRSILPRHLQSDLSRQDPFSAAFQSFDSLLRRLFLFDAVRNPHPLIHSWVSYLGFKYAILLLLTVAAVQAVWRAERSGDPKAQKLSVAMLGIWGLLIAPATATYHFVLLWLPIGCLLSYLRSRGKSGLFCLSLGLYTGIGFVPYGYFASLAGRGAFSLVAYPRLWLTCALFFVALASAAGPNAANSDKNQTTKPGITRI